MQVITTYGPRKPQRHSSNVNLTIDADIGAAVTPTHSQHLRLETSFTSLQSPGRGDPYPLISCSSKSSIGGSLFSRSQLNSILHVDGSVYDDNARSTPMASETATVILSEHQSQRGKSVAFDIKSPSCPSGSSISPNFLLKSILHRHKNGGGGGGDPTKKVSLQDINKSIHNIDILDDDWYGRAPLASPETLSEISSICSRTSIALNLATSIENYLHRIGRPENGIKTIEADIFESQLHTPIVMRRAPKITGNLSTCAEDWQSVDKYKRMGKVFVTNPVPLLSSSSGSSQSECFESTGSLTRSKCCTTNVTTTKKNSHSVDSIDNDYGTSIASTKLTWSDSAILDGGGGGGCLSNCPKCPCKRSNGLRPACCTKNDHSWCGSDSDDQQNTSSTSDTYYSAVSSLATIDTIQMYNNNTTSAAANLPSGVLESHFPVYSDGNDSESSSLLPTSTKAKSSPKLFQKANGNGNDNRATMDGGFKRISREYERDRFFVRNDSLPLLAGLVERSSPNSFNRRRNHAVYPMNSSPHHTPSKKTESNV